MQMVKDNRKLKGLYTLLQKSQADRELARQEMKAVQEKLTIINSQIKNLTDQIKKYEEDKKIEITITEHAINRYLEYKYNLNMEEIINEIVPNSSVEQYNKLGNGKYPTSTNGIIVVLKDNTAITIIKNNKGVDNAKL
jgi:DNA-nicking Smr family endonuclease